MSGVLVLGSPAAVALAGAPAPAAPDLIVALDDAVVASVGTTPVVRWRSRPANAVDGERLVAPDGDGLWSRSPWPVRDELFALAPAPLGALTVVESDPERRSSFTRLLGDSGLEATLVDRLSVDVLAGADVVVHGAGVDGPLPGDAFAVLAAGRLLITGCCSPGFGLLPGIDHLAASELSLACAFAGAVAGRPSSFGVMRALGRVAAERHRASAVYATLASNISNAGP